MLYLLHLSILLLMALGQGLYQQWTVRGDLLQIHDLEPLEIQAIVIGLFEFELMEEPVKQVAEVQKLKLLWLMCQLLAQADIISLIRFTRQVGSILLMASLVTTLVEELVIIKLFVTIKQQG